ncbi:MFS transporter [Phenylobacterium sp.]|uniref:MFS transporter n=1 Tax=Phenylobacterium sp. TaxID=1871053 RepID=UPI002BB23A93|nr:MFS transporter [Phenylobacterium sp.]HVI33769.1 MFS transporter [Phenylobacterium sp.]
MTLVVLDAGIVNVALPELSRVLVVGSSEGILVVTAYQAGLVMALLPAGALGERLGHRRVFTFGVLLFAAASAGCAISPSLPWLVAARFVQGLGGAAIMALGVALLRLTVARERLGAAIGWNALTVALASAAAPSLGAAILSVAPWPALFAINLPVAVAALLAARALPASIPGGASPDGVSMALNAAAFGALIVAGEAVLATPGPAIGLAFAGVVVMALLARREASKPSPLLPLDLLRSEPFRLSVIASILCFMAQSMGLLALPFLLQRDLGQTLLQAGAYMTFWPLTVAATSIVASRLADRVPTAWLCAAGAALLAVGLAGAAAWPLGGQAEKLLPFLGLCGAGFGLFQSPNNRNLFLSAAAERSGAAGGMQGTARVTGQTAGSVIVALLFSVPVSAPSVSLALAAALALLAGLVSLFRIPGEQPRPAQGSQES